MSTAFTITILVPDGRPDGLRIIEKSNWTGRGIDLARADWPAVRNRSDFDKPGVYVLSATTDEGDRAIYVGEADELRSRLNQHYANVDFWTRAVVFLSKDENLNKAGVKFLEAKLFALAKRARRATLVNGNTPSTPSLSEADLVEAEGFLEEMLPIYPLLGIDAFELVPPRRQAGVRATADSAERLQIERSGIVAYGRDAVEGFVVEAGTTARIKEVPSIHPYMHAIRTKLISEGLLVADGSVYRLVQDYVFSSPSTAAGVLLGRPANGRTEWHDSHGRTLKQLQQERAS